MSTAFLSLHTLTLQNFATFDNVSVSFNQNFNAIIGETGSGKSLILDALQLILGQRAERSLIRKGADFAVVEATFSVSGDSVRDFFNGIGHPYDGNEIVVKRIIYQNESSKSFLNFQSCSLGILQRVSARFVDLVGQFENQKLLRDDYQLILLDSYAGLKDKVRDFQRLYQEFVSKKNQLRSLELKQKEKSQREDYLRFQASEIESLSPTKEDEDHLIDQKERTLHRDDYLKSLQGSLEILSEGDQNNTLSTLSMAIKTLEAKLGDDPSLSKLKDAKELIEEVSYDLSKRITADEEEEIDLEQVIDRLDHYQKLKHKFGVETDELVSILQDINNELAEYEVIDSEINKVTLELKEIESRLKVQANFLHEKRVSSAKTLSKKLSENVRSLLMKGATINIAMVKTEEMNEYGLSRIDFKAETNPGEGFYPVKKIASGGELSRILLAFRQILSTTDSISVFLFDEIDTGIGGETALHIGNSLKDVSTSSQVIAITHLPQIAHYADKLIHVKKEITDKSNRTLSLIKEIEGKERTAHVKQMNPI